MSCYFMLPLYLVIKTGWQTNILKSFKNSTGAEPAIPSCSKVSHREGLLGLFLVLFYLMNKLIVVFSILQFTGATILQVWKLKLLLIS